MTDDVKPGGTMGDAGMTASGSDLFELAPCGYVVTQPDGTFTRVNRAFLDWTGYTGDELVGRKRFQDLLTLPGKIFYENQFFPLLTMQGFVREVAFNMIGRNGDDLPLLVNSTRTAGADGRPQLVLSTLFMASDRRAYETELLRARQDAERLSAIVTLSADAIVRCSPGGLVETWNPGARIMFGLEEREARGMHLRQILPSVDDAEWVRVHGALLGGESVYFEAEGRRADGRTVDVSVGLSPHFGALRELAAVSAIIRDISESKALQRLQYEFLAMTSHELRTPLTSIRGHAQLLLRRGVYVQAHLERIVEATDHLGRLVDDLLLASRLESGHFDLQPTSIDLRSVVDAAAHDLMSERNIHIELPDEPLPVWGDPQRLGQVFANLLSNALKYSPPDTDVTVHATRSPMEASVTVIDRGVGIPASALPHLFDRFYRVSGTAHRAQGAGLGLYIANHMVRAHGGHLRVESEVGRGSAFTVSLPILEDAPDLDTSRRSSDGVTTSSV